MEVRSKYKKGAEKQTVKHLVGKFFVVRKHFTGVLLTANKSKYASIPTVLHVEMSLRITSQPVHGYTFPVTF